MDGRDDRRGPHRARRRRSQALARSRRRALLRGDRPTPENYRIVRRAHPPRGEGLRAQRLQDRAGPTRPIVRALTDGRRGEAQPMTETRHIGMPDQPRRRPRQGDGRRASTRPNTTSPASPSASSSPARSHAGESPTLDTSAALAAAGRDPGLLARRPARRSPSRTKAMATISPRQASRSDRSSMTRSSTAPSPWRWSSRTSFELARYAAALVRVEYQIEAARDRPGRRPRETIRLAKSATGIDPPPEARGDADGALAAAPP